MDVLLTALIVVPAGYLAGSLPTAYIVTRAAKGFDIRTVGSGNAGAVNVYRQVGPWAGILVLNLDALKGAAVILAIRAAGLPDHSLFAGALAAVVGHNWPVFLGFRGGKGVAVILGISLAVLPVWTPVSLAIALAGGLATRNVVFGIAAGIIALNVLTIATGQDLLQISLCLTLSVLVIATHYALSYQQALESVREKGVWGLFTPE